MSAGVTVSLDELSAAKRSAFSDRDLESILSEHHDVPGASVAIINDYLIRGVTAGYARVATRDRMHTNHYLQIASLSKTIAAAFAHEYFNSRNISMDTSVNSLLKSLPNRQTNWLITATSQAYNADSVTLAMLINHTALGMHYVYGIPLSDPTPSPLECMTATGLAAKYGYEYLRLARPAGEQFSYSGGGFVVMQYLLETMEGTSIDLLTRDFCLGCGLDDFTFLQNNAKPDAQIAYGHLPPATPAEIATASSGSGCSSGLLREVPALAFPPLAAGALCAPTTLATFLCHLAHAYHNNQGSGAISYATARRMLDEEHCVDLGAMDFMGARMGSGVFVATAGRNRIMFHQAANDGFRGLYMHCFDGPCTGKGFVVLANGDNPAVLFQCAVVRRLLADLNFSGIDFNQYKEEDLHYDFSGMKQETIVNRGLKDLVTSAFLNGNASSNQKIARL